MSVAIPEASARRQLAAYIELTKPRIVMLVVMTGVPALLLAAHGFPGPRVFLGTLLGTILAASSAASFNMYFDRDIDARMRRTASRPLPAGILPPSSALGLAFVLAGTSWVVLIMSANLLAASIGLLSIFYYAIVYTVWLKRRTPQNIVIGGAAGASAPLIAWAAVTGHVSPAAIVLSAIVFLWTPPHFWALALYRSQDYADAQVPMLPVTHGEAETRTQIVVYAFVLVACTLLLGPLGLAGPVYMIAAALLGGIFIARALRLRKSKALPDAMRLFGFSILYLFLLYLVLTLDAVLRFALPFGR